MPLDVTYIHQLDRGRPFILNKREVFAVFQIMYLVWGISGAGENSFSALPSTALLWLSALLSSLPVATDQNSQCLMEQWAFPPTCVLLLGRYSIPQKQSAMPTYYT